jgi:hypothetical protein
MLGFILLHIGLYIALALEIIAGRKNVSIILAAFGLVASLVELSMIYILLGG